MTEAANMTREFVHYRQLERRLWLIRWRNAGEESVEEDGILDEMDRTWMQLSEREQAILRAEGPRCRPMDSSARARQEKPRCPERPQTGNLGSAGLTACATKM